MEEALTLYELNGQVRETIEKSFPCEYWLQAELSDVRANSSGHCYVEFIQKEEHGNSILAKARGTIWSNVYRMLKPYFEKETGQTFAAGLTVLVKVSISFHELYGYSLVVTDIDPAYTLGDMARRRREILNRLQEEGVLELNKELEMPFPAQRIAVISSPTAAGYGDFCHQLQHNAKGFVFYVKLFPALMQGDGVEDSVIAALDEIYKEQNLWDVVVLIRGGGSTSDLSGFDTYNLAANCAQYPLPLLVGLGHERDETVIDDVAHTSVKTPTAAAAFLIDRMQKVADLIHESQSYIITIIQQRVNEEKMRLQNRMMKLPSYILQRVADEKLRIQQQQNHLVQVYSNRVQKEKNHIYILQQNIPIWIKQIIERENHRLQLQEQKVKAESPERVLSRGYTLTLKDGKVVTDITALQAGDQLVSRFAKGEVTSIVSPKSSKYSDNYERTDV